MLLPSKLQSGQNFKTATVNTVNQIIEYLKTQRLVSDNKTIKLNQLTSGIAISAVQGSSPLSAGKSSIDHPFKLKIVTDEQGKQTLNITQARIIINGDQGTRVYFGYEENDIGLPMNLKLPQQQGIWNVDGYIVFDDNAPSNELNSLGWGAGCVYSNYDSTTAQFTLSSGFYHFIIGTIECTKTQQGNFVYSVYRQLLFSSLTVDDGGIYRDFRGHWQKSTYPTDGSIVEDFIADKFIINAGKLFVDGVMYQINQYTEYQTPQSDTLYCVQFDVNFTVYTITKVDTSEWKYFDQETATYLMPICLAYPSNISAVALIQFIFGSIYFNTKGKILLNQEDQLPSEYLQKKIRYETKNASGMDQEQKKKYGDNGYIIGITTDANEESQSQQKVKNLYDKLYWDWTAISGYKKDEKQKLMNEENSLKWVKDQDDQNKPQHKVQGSLDALLEFQTQTQQVQGSTPQQKQQKLIVKLRYKPQYSVDLENGDTNLSTCFIIQDKSGKIDRITYTEKQNGDGVMVWDYTEKSPVIANPPEAEQGQQDKQYCLVGKAGEKVTWQEYNAGTISLQGSIQNVFQIAVSEEQETKGQNVLRVSSQYDGSVTQFHFLNLDEQGKLQATTLQGQGKDSLMLWDNEQKYPFTLDCLQALEDSIYVLSGDLENGVHWVDLADYTGTVKCTEQDQAGYLLDKIESIVDESILVQLNDENTFQTVNLSVNPEWFISSDESIVITYTEDGLLDFTGAGMVQVTEDDVPDFLINKIASTKEHITIDVDYDDLGMFLDLNINPLAFISSDETIFIEETEDGLIDLYGAGRVQVTEQDQAGYLIDKLGSSKEHLTIQTNGDDLGTYVDLNIDPTAFTSSDYSVTIEENEQGFIDITEAGRVQVNADDSPDYLDQKLVSQNESIIIEHGQGNGESMNMNFEINPQYFISSDESIIITPTQDGYLDFTGAGMVQVTEDDQPGFLIDKLGSSKAHLTVDVDSDSLGMYVDLNIDVSAFYSSDETVIIEETEQGIDFYGAGKVQVNADDVAGYLGEKIESEDGTIIITPTENIVDLALNTDIFTSSDGSVIIQPNDNGEIDFRVEAIANLQSQKQSIIITDPPQGAQQPIIKIDINPSYFISSDESVTIEETEQGLDFTGAGKVQVNENDTAGFLSEKITSEDNTIIVEDVGSAVDLALNTDIFYSSDESITVESTEQGVDLRSECKVKLDENDTPTYLAEKFQNNDIINFQNQGSVLTAELGAQAVISSDDSIDVEITNGFADIKSKGKVKCSQEDTADFLNSKINVDPSIAGLITLDKQANQILIKSALQGSGLLAIQNGVITPISAPSSGKYLLACNQGNFAWMQYKDCENACQ